MKIAVSIVRSIDEAVRNGYRLSIQFNKRQRLPKTVRYRWHRATMKGSSVFTDYWNVNYGEFNVLLVTQLTEEVDSFIVSKV